MSAPSTGALRFRALQVVFIEMKLFVYCLLGNVGTLYKTASIDSHHLVKVARLLLPCEPRRSYQNNGKYIFMLTFYHN